VDGNGRSIGEEVTEEVTFLLVIGTLVAVETEDPEWLDCDTVLCGSMIFHSHGL